MPAISQVTLSTAPRQVTAIPGDSQVIVRWLPPFNTGGQAITGYSVTYGPTTASPTSSSYQTVGCSTGGSLSCTVTGLTNGTAYTFRVLAVNSSGNGIPSYSSSVKPGSAVIVSPSTLALSGLGSGIYRAFTLKNTTLFPVTITQTPTTSDFSPALPTGTTLYTTTCTIDTVLNPGDSCSVTIKPGSIASAMSSPNTASACTANVAGRTAPAANVIQLQTDTGTISAQVLVLGYGCTYQSGYVFSIDDSVANILSVAGKVAATADQGSNKIWASNGAGSAVSQVSLDLIPGIDYTSTGAAPSPTGSAFVSFFLPIIRISIPLRPHLLLLVKERWMGNVILIIPYSFIISLLPTITIQALLNLPLVLDQLIHPIMLLAYARIRLVVIMIGIYQRFVKWDMINTIVVLVVVPQEHLLCKIYNLI